LFSTEIVTSDKKGRWGHRKEAAATRAWQWSE